MSGNAVFCDIRPHDELDGSQKEMLTGVYSVARALEDRCTVSKYVCEERGPVQFCTSSLDIPSKMEFCDFNKSFQRATINDEFGIGLFVS